MKHTRAPLRLAIIGCGDIAQKSYLPGLASEFGGLARVVSVCDGVEARARLVAGRWKTAAFADAGAMFRAVPSDVAVVLTPLLTHAKVARQALAAGRHVYTEKPFARSVAEANAVLSLARRRRLVVGAAPSSSVTPAIREARRLLRAGAIGKVCLARAHSSHGGPGGIWNTDYSWVYRRAISGPIPPVYDMGIYGLAMLVSLLGPVSRVTGLAGLGISPRKIEVKDRKPYWLVPDGLDNSYLLLDFGAGRLAALDASFCLRDSDGDPVELFGSAGMMTLNPWGGRIRVRSLEGAAGLPRGRWSVRHAAPAPGGSFLAGLHHLLSCVRAGREPMNGAAFTRHLVDVMESGIRGALTGRTVRLRTSFDHGRMT